MYWLTTRPVPAGWLLWPDKQPQLQGAAFRSCGFVLSETLVQIELPFGACCRPAAQELLCAGLIRFAGTSDLEALSKFYGLCYQIPFGCA